MHSVVMIRPIATYGIAWSVGRSVTIDSPAQSAVQMEKSFGMWTRVGPRKHVLDEVHISTREGAILRAEMSRHMTCPE